MYYLPENAKQLTDIIEPDKPFRLSATVYDGEQQYLIKPQHCFDTATSKRSDVIKTMFNQLQDKAKNLTFDRAISYVSGSQHVLQFNFTL